MQREREIKRERGGEDRKNERNISNRLFWYYWIWRKGGAIAKKEKTGEAYSCYNVIQFKEVERIGKGIYRKRKR